MGLSFSILKNWWYGPPMRIVIGGIDNAGKTSILYRLKLRDLVRSIPTIGFNVETVTYRNLNLTIWDMGGGDKLRPLNYIYYTHDLQAIIWVTDSTDMERFGLSKEELDFLLSQEHVKGVRLLVFNTKSDLENATPSAEVAELLGLKELKDREWCIVTCSSQTGEGLWEGIEKLTLSLTGEKPMNGEIY